MIVLLRRTLSVFVLFAAMLMLAAGSTLLSYLKSIEPTLPDSSRVASWRPHGGTRILAADGTVMGVHSRERREFVPLARIPPLVVNAFLAAEDGNYWRHSGIDPTALARAFLANMRDRNSLQGGSTITQQVVKNLVVGDDRTMERKIREALIALRLDRELGKEKVLEIYLNEIYLGAGAYGVAEAAKTYFGKSLDQVTPAQAALIAALPKAPSAANPFANPSRALERRNYVIERMVQEGFISPSAGDAARREPIATVPSAQGRGHPEAAFWYAEEEVRRLLISRIGADSVYGEGGVARTTIRPELQRLVHATLRKGLVVEDRRGGWRGPLARNVSFPVDWTDRRLDKPDGAEDWTVGVVAHVDRDAVIETRTSRLNVTGSSMRWAAPGGRASAVLRKGDVVLIADLGNGPEIVQIPKVQGAVVVMDPQSGDVLAMVGGFSPETSQFNRATQARRQTGSVFKTFVYLAALEIGFDGTSPVLDAPIALSQGPGLEDWRPKDASGHGLGLITLRRSLEQSRNMSTVRLLHDVGMDHVRSVADRVGLRLPHDASYAMALGASEATPVEIAAAYAALANGGRRVAPRYLLDDEANLGDEIIDPIAVAQVTSILRGVVSSGTARRAFDGFEAPVAGKTGTTNDARDAWFVAYGPRFIVTVWVGNDDYSPLKKGSSGSATAAPIARNILENAKDLVFEEFRLPEGAEEILVSRQTGHPAADGDLVEIIRTGSRRVYDE